MSTAATDVDLQCAWMDAILQLSRETRAIGDTILDAGLTNSLAAQHTVKGKLLDFALAQAKPYVTPPKLELLKRNG